MKHVPWKRAGPASLRSVTLSRRAWPATSSPTWPWRTAACGRPAWTFTTPPRANGTPAGCAASTPTASAGSACRSRAGPCAGSHCSRRLAVKSRSATANDDSSGNWRVPRAGALSLLELDGPRWRLCDVSKDLDADELVNMVADDGAVLVSSNRGVHRWEAAGKAWKKLDTGAALVNS